jgi:hypothetical protein
MNDARPGNDCAKCHGTKRIVYAHVEDVVDATPPDARGGQASS